MAIFGFLDALHTESSPTPVTQITFNSIIMVRFHAISAYKNYLGETVISRPEAWLLPRLDLDQNNQIYMAPGEVYCRFRDADGHLHSALSGMPRRSFFSLFTDVPRRNHPVHFHVVLS